MEKENTQPAAALEGDSSLAVAAATTPSVAVPKPRLAHGFRFHPTDEELVVYFLHRKVCRKPFRFEAIAEIDIYKSEPWELQAFCAVNSRDQEWHFFTRVEKKYVNGSKINRSTSKGYWKTTGKDRMVRHKSEIVAMKKTLVYHEGRAPNGSRTDWIMHEYRLVDEVLEKAGVDKKDSYFLCKIYIKNESMGRRGGPFNEEDWENDANLLVVPCDDAEDEEDSQGASSKAVQLPVIREREEDDEAVCIDKGKKPKLVMLNLFSSNEKSGSESSSSSTAIIPDSQPTKMSAPTDEFSPRLLDFSLSSAQPKLQEENHNAAPPKVSGSFHSSSLEKSLPPGYLKFITDLEQERDNLKHSLMNSEAIVSCLQSDNERLAEEIKRLKDLLQKD